MSVAVRTPSSSAARAGASVRMSATTTSGASSRTSGTVSRVACTTASKKSRGSGPEGNTRYSGAGAKAIPSASTCSRQRSHVCSVTSCPRAASARPRAIIGKACPGSPNAPSSTRLGGAPAAFMRARSGGQLGEQPQLLQALLGSERRGGHAEGPHARIAVDGQALAHHVLGAAQRDGVDQRVGDRGHRLLALAFEVEVLDLLRVRLVAVALDEVVVEVLLARAHPADIERDERAHAVARALDVVGDAQADGGGDVEVIERFARAVRAFLEQRAQLGDMLG